MNKEIEQGNHGLTILLILRIQEMGYPTREEIDEIFAGLANGKTDDFFSHVSPNVTWDVLGDHYAAGHFTTLEDWKKGALGRINKVLREPLQLRIHNIVGGGQEWATVELKADAVCKNGLEYNQQYAWVCRFNEKAIIVEVRAYLDSALVNKAILQNS